MPETLADIDLTKELKQLLNAALLSAFQGSFEELHRMVDLELGDPLHEISDALALGPGVREVIRWAEKNGRVRELSEVLFAKRGGNNDVRKYRAALAEADAALPPAQQDFEKWHIPDEWSARLSGLEALGVSPNKLVRATGWREAMREAERRVCRIDGPAGTAQGTGFLVGKDLVLTNCHVYRLVEHRKPVARFDFTSTGANCEDVPIKEPPLAVSSEQELDFALMRLSRPVDEDRGWFRPQDHVPVIDEVQVILQHPAGRPLEVGFGRVTGVKQSPPLVTYKTNTEGGSSGSPAFNMDWQLVALHQYGIAGVENGGLPMREIWKKLAKKKLV